MAAMLKENAGAVPQGEKALENAVNNCTKRNKFVEDSQENAPKYIERSKRDLGTAITDLENKVYDWSLVKAYNSILFAENAILVRKFGIFSKDHTCAINKLRLDGLIDGSLFEDLKKIYAGRENLFDDAIVSRIFEARKTGLYGLEDWKNFTEEDARIAIDCARRILKLAAKMCVK